MLEKEFIDRGFREPIPKLASSNGWKEVQIKENGERLVALNDLDKDLICVDPQYFKQGIPHALSIMYLREGAANALIKAAKLLPKGFKLLVYDAWRPLEVQQSLFDKFLQRLRVENPNWDEERLFVETQKYVSLPSSNPNCPSPHNTGGAVDLSICNLRNVPLPMGAPFDFFGKEASTNYFEGLRNISLNQILFRNNRRMLYHIMTSVGFTNYDEEYWHFDLGNQFDAVRKGTIAVYGATCPK